MYYLFSALIGFIIAVMITVNGQLTVQYGVYPATVIIHVVGIVLVGALVLARREKLRPRARLPLYCFMGGLVGVATTVFNNLAFGVISVSAILALELLGQSVASMLIDGVGALGVEKQPFHPKKLIGFGLCLAGIVVMLAF